MTRWPNEEAFLNNVCKKKCVVKVGNSGLVEFSSLAGEGGEYQVRCNLKDSKRKKIKK